MSFQRYGTLVELAHDLFCREGEWYDTPFKRKMVVIRLSSGGLVVHNPFRLMEYDVQGLKSLGKVETVIVPNSFHSSEAHYFMKAFSDSKLLVSKAAENNVRKLAKVDGLLPEDWPHETEVGCLEFRGTRILGENVFVHRKSRTLIATDLVFNMQDDVSGGLKTFFKLNKIYKRFGPSRIFRHVFVNDLDLVRQSLHEILEWDFDRVIMSHGQILNTGGKDALVSSFKEMGIY